MFNKIPWKTIQIETIAESGVKLKGELQYWSKDQSVSLLEPIRSAGKNSHLPYSLPRKFTYDEKRSDERHIKGEYGWISINLAYIAKEELRRLYAEALAKV